jgi:hypothetical protein
VTPAKPTAPAIPENGGLRAAAGSSLRPCTQTTLNGTTAGSAISSEPILSSARKKFSVYLNGYENTTGTAQTISMPVPFATVVGAASTLSGTCTGVTATTSTVTLPSSMGATQTGLCEFDGY